MKINCKKGISLIVLIITIIVILILAGTTVLSLSTINPISKVNEATFKNSLVEFESELNSYITQKYVENLGNYDEKTLDVTKITTPSITDVITSMKDKKFQNIPYDELLEIEDGKISY